MYVVGESTRKQQSSWTWCVMGAGDREGPQGSWAGQGAGRKWCWGEETEAARMPETPPRSD